MQKPCTGGVAAEEARQLADLEVVMRQSNATLEALQGTADALDELEAAAAAVERAKGRADEQVRKLSSSPSPLLLLESLAMRSPWRSMR